MARESQSRRSQSAHRSCQGHSNSRQGSDRQAPRQQGMGKSFSANTAHAKVVIAFYDARDAKKVSDKLSTNKVHFSTGEWVQLRCANLAYETVRQVRCLHWSSLMLDRWCERRSWSGPRGPGGDCQDRRAQPEPCFNRGHGGKLVRRTRELTPVMPGYGRRRQEDGGTRLDGERNRQGECH
jgi:hypothetical protein